MRAAIKGFAARGTNALYTDAPGPEPDEGRRAEVTSEPPELLGQDRTWAGRQPAEAPGAGIGHRQTRRYPAHFKAGYRRTAQTACHKQNSARAGRAARVLGGLTEERQPAG